MKNILEYLWNSLGQNSKNPQLNLYQLIRVFLIILVGGVMILSLFYAQGAQIVYYIGAVLVLIWGIVIVNKRIGVFKRLADYQEKWGQEVNFKQDFADLKEYFELKMDTESHFMIDDRTWEDLNMNLIYQKIDRCLSIVGEKVLYYILRKPLFKSDELAKRDQIISSIEEDLTLRQSLQRVLSEIGHTGGEGIAGFIWGDLPNSRPIWLYYLLRLVSVGGIIYGVYNPAFLLYIAGGVIALNMFIYYREKKKIANYLSPLFYLGRILTGVKRFLKEDITNPEVAEYQRTLKKHFRGVKSITKKTIAFQLKNDPIAEYFFILLQTEALTFNKLINIVKKNQKELQEIFNLIGELDAYLAIASYREGLDYYAKPDLRRTRETLLVQDLYHPLLEDPVSNSFTLAKGGALLTGSNMSGKSTMLRAIGINALLSQTIYTSPTRRYLGNYYKLVTSIGRSDNVITGDSYYLVEAKALRRIIEKVGPGVRTLAIVDEIFRGTNSLERIAASSEVLKYLANQNCTIFAATHDLELTEILEGELENYHFKEDVNEKGLNFDYLLRSGPSTTRNAIKLLDHLGYPAEVVRGSQKRVARVEAEEKLSTT